MYHAVWVGCLFAWPEEFQLIKIESSNCLQCYFLLVFCGPKFKCLEEKGVRRNIKGEQRIFLILKKVLSGWNWEWVAERSVGIWHCCMGSTLQEVARPQKRWQCGALWEAGPWPKDTHLQRNHSQMWHGSCTASWLEGLMENGIKRAWKRSLKITY